jgi:methionyl-tRNA formyltransferase
LKVVFAGTPDFAATILRGLLDSEHEVGLVISQPDTRRGRGRKLSAPPVAELAKAEEIPLLQPDRIGDVARQIGQHDALVVAAYGQILRADTLYAAEGGAWNVHASLLPAYRGAAPIERAIMNGEEETGVSIMLMDEGLDTGPVALQRKTPLGPTVNAGKLTKSLARLGSEAIVEALSFVEKGSYDLTEQDESKATYASKLSARDRILRWELPAGRIHDQVRALAPGIGARTFHPAFEGPIKVLRSRVLEKRKRPSPEMQPGSIVPAKNDLLVQCGEGRLRVDELQVPGGKSVESREFLRGNSLAGSFDGPPL